MLITTSTLAGTPYRKLKLPAGVKQCRRCTILMGRNHVPAGTRHADICKWCEKELSDEEIEELSKESRTVSEVTTTNESHDTMEERVAQWAEWRRNGRSYSWISNHDETGPSYPTIRKYLEEYGYTPDGDPGDVKSAVDLPEGWGEIETDVLPPTRAAGKYGSLIEHIKETITTEWARMEAPSGGASSYLKNLLRKSIKGCQTASRTIDGKKYLYFRIKEVN